MRFVSQFEADQFLTIFELIRAGFGVSIVPEMAKSLSHGSVKDELPILLLVFAVPALVAVFTIWRMSR